MEDSLYTLLKNKIDSIVDLQNSNMDSLTTLLNNDISAYKEILEKTNTQLSFIYNPYGIMISALGVLFTIGAIIVGFIIFRQNSEYKKALREFWNKRKEEIDEFIKNREIKDAKWKDEQNEKLKELVKSVEQLSDDEVEGQQGEIEKIKKQIDEINIERKTYEAMYPSFNVGTATSGTSRSPTFGNIRKCPHCGYENYARSTSWTGLIQCSNCHNAFA